MPLNVKIASKVPGTEGVFKASGSLSTEGQSLGKATVLVEDLGKGKAQLILLPDVQVTELNGNEVKEFKGNIVAEYDGENLTKGELLSFSAFSFTHK